MVPSISVMRSRCLGNHTSKGILSALLLRQSIIRVARAQLDAHSLPSAQQMLQLGALWLLPWSRWSSPLVRCLFMAWLQWSPKGALCPPLAVFTLIATALRKFSKRSAFWSLALPPMISGSITIVMHETPWLISSSYLDMLRALSGASRPLYDWRGSVMSTPNPAISASSSHPLALSAEDDGKTPTASSSASEMLRFWWRTFVHAFKVFLIGYGVIKPLIRRKLPPVMDILFATLRTSSWISIAGIVVTICGWIRIPGSPLLACLARLLISGAFSQMVAIEGKDELEGVVSFMLGQALMVVASALQRVLWRASEVVDGRSSFLAENTATARATEVAAQPVASPHSASSLLPALPLQPLPKDSTPARSLLSHALLSISDVQSIFSLVLPVLQMMQPKAAKVDAAAAAAEVAEESLAAGLRRTMITKSALVSLVERSIS